MNIVGEWKRAYGRCMFVCVCAAVGEVNVVEAMKKNQVVIGGEGGGEEQTLRGSVYGS